MRRAVATLAAVLALNAPAAAQRHGDGASSVPLIDVPYVSQGELLCGGAAAAMLMRAAGARRVYAEDFQSLVDVAAGGIHTQDLAEALRERGYGAQVFQGTQAIAERFLAAGRPVLALIQDRPGRFHYVVLVGWGAGGVTFHDPARAPFLKRSDAAFDAAWAPALRWMLVLDPPAKPTSAPDTEVPLSVPSPTRDAAIARFLERDYLQSAKLAEKAVQVNPEDRESWRLLGASRYLSADAAGALDAWNRAGDPTIDLVRLEGLSRTPHRAVETLIGLRPGSMLTRGEMVRADRRLWLLPARDASRVSYVALPGNLAEVRGAVVEHPLVPSRIEWIATGARLAINRELSVSFANVASAGDRLTTTWRFWDGRPAAGVRFGMPAPALGGVATLSVDWQQEHYATAPPSDRRQALAVWTNWLTARVRASAGVGVAEWTDRGRAAILQGGVEYRPLNGRVALELTSRRAMGEVAGFGMATALVRWRRANRTVVFSGTTALAHASSRAPLDEWPGAGIGIARPLLLRAHPLLTDGRIAGPAFGRTIAQSTLEAERSVARRAFATLGVAMFVDVARAWDRADRSASPVHVDAGAGVRLRLAPGQPAIRLDYAHGLRDGNDAISAGWEVGWNR
jgi:hypothetical protein